MANLSIRKLDDKIYEQLRKRSLKHHISLEEEVRQIITQAVTAPESISNLFQKNFGIKNGVDLDFLNQREPHQPMDFEE